MYSERKLSTKVFSCILVLSMMLNFLLIPGLFPATVQAAGTDGLVYYVDGVGSEGADGLSAATAFKTINEVNDAVAALSGVADKLLTIVICGKVDASADGVTVSGVKTDGSTVTSGDYRSLSSHKGGVVFTSKDSTTDYRITKSAKITLPKSYMLLCNTTFENITFVENTWNAMANYYDFTLGEGVSGTFIRNTIFLGTNNQIYYALEGSELKTSLKQRDMTITVKSGTIKSIDLFGSGDQGWTNNNENGYNVTLNIEGGSLTSVIGNANKAKPVVNNVTVNLGASVATADLTALNGNARIRGTKTIGYIGTTVSELPAGFTALKLTNASAELAALKNVTDITMDDASRLTLTAAPSAAVNVTVTKAGDKWNTTEALITAPAGTAEDMFLLAEGEWTYASDANATWTLVGGAEEEPTDPTPTEPVVENDVFFVNNGVAASGDGKTAATAFKTVAEAYAALNHDEDTDKTTIVICGSWVTAQTGATKSGNSWYLGAHKGEVVFTSVYDGVDYRKTNSAKIVLGLYWHLGGNTKFENIVIGSRAFGLYMNYHNLHLGNDVTVFTNATTNTTVAERCVAAYLYLGSSDTFKDALDVSEKDVALTMESGVVHVLNAPANTANPKKITLNITGGEITMFDLKGRSNVEANLGEGVELPVVDTANTKKDASTAGKLTVNGAGAAKLETSNAANVMSAPAANKVVRYLKVQNADGTYSFHPFNLSVVQYGLNTVAGTITLRVAMMANDVAAQAIESYGVYSVTSEKAYAVGTSIEGSYIEACVDLTNSLDVANIDKTVKYAAYVSVGGEVIRSATEVDITPSAVLEMIAEGIKGETIVLNGEQIGRIKGLMADNARINEIFGGCFN